MIKRITTNQENNGNYYQSRNPCEFRTNKVKK